MIYRLFREQIVPASQIEVWEYFATPHNLNEMTPPDLKFEIVHGGREKMFQGQLIEYRVQFMPLFRSRWLTEITHIDEKSFFVDEQRVGPYLIWHHEHRFKAVEAGTRIIDQVTYLLPFGPLGDLVHAIWIRSRLQAIFDFRQKKVKAVFDPKGIL